MAGKKTRCAAYVAFIANINRSRAFLRMFDQPGGHPRGAGQPSSDEKELLRGAVVFAVGALDAFLHEIVLEIVTTFGGDHTALSDAMKQIAKDDPSLALRVSLVQRDADRRQVFADALGDWLSQKSFQGPEAVIRALGYVGCGLGWNDFDAATGKNTAERLAHFTDLRHKIVHRGSQPYIVRNTAEECVVMVDAVVGLINRDVVQFYHAPA